jgi:hypothetical protein
MEVNNLKILQYAFKISMKIVLLFGWVMKCREKRHSFRVLAGPPKSRSVFSCSI